MEVQKALQLQYGHPRLCQVIPSGALRTNIKNPIDPGRNCGEIHPNRGNLDL